MSIIRTVHRVGGKDLVLASRSELNDVFSERLRSQSWRLNDHSKVACQLLKSGDFFLDLGANVGTFCVPVSLVTGATCLAVEALQSNIPVLQSAIEANDLSDRIEWALAAIVEADGAVRIAGASAYGTVSKNGKRVLAYSLDGMMEDYGWGKVALVKMDIEGSEMKALLGAPRFMDRNPEATFIFEANGAHCVANGYMPQDLIRFFEKRGRVVYMSRGGRLVRRTSHDFQEAGLADYVASPFPLEGAISGKFDDFDNTFKLTSVENTLSNMKSGYKLFMLKQMSMAPAFVSSNEKIKALVDAARAELEYY